MTEHGELRNVRVYNDPDREEDDPRPLYQRMAANEPGPIAGALVLDGPSLDAIASAALNKIARIADGRDVQITRIIAGPFSETEDGWTATIEWKIAPTLGYPH